MARTHKHDRIYRAELEALDTKKRVLEAVEHLHNMIRNPTEVDAKEVATLYMVKFEDVWSMYLML